LHILTRHADGLQRCVGCELCAVACPADAIFVQAAENDPDHPVSHGERYAERYEINMLRCIFCGMCEEACPEDAIYLEKDYELSDYDRDAFIYTKDEDGVGGAGDRAQLAAHAALEPVLVACEDVEPAKAREHLSFSSGYWTVNGFLNRFSKVTPRPWPSSFSILGSCSRIG